MAARNGQYVLGVNSGPHDGAAALLRDGELVAMVEQERLSRSRHAFHESPRDAIAACLAHAGVELREVSEIAVGWDVPTLMADDGLAYDEEEFVSWLLGCNRSGCTPPLRFVDHHLAHAASAFYTSGFTDAVILVLDGRGERVATTLAMGGPDGIKTLRTWGTNQSLGHVYGWAAEWVGLTMWGTGKLMGLAAYGAPGQPMPFTCTESGYAVANAPPQEARSSDHFLQLRSRVRHHFRERNYPYEECAAGDIAAFASFAASMQASLEEVVTHLATIAVQLTGLRRLVLAGGVALNCSANGKLVRSGVVEELWVPPFPYDAGVSVGAAFVADRVRHPRRLHRRLTHARWAPEAGNLDLQRVPELSDCSTHRVSDDDALADEVAALLANGALVAWFNGRAEVGQRALGGRSILCDPRRRSALVELNKVKGRETWRPLAPAVLADQADMLFDGPLPALTSFMLAAWPVREAARSKISAAVHVDGTARPQLVTPEDGAFYRVIEAFRDRTGVPAVINTSFNLAGEPIVLTPGDAVSTFVRSGLDVLVVDDQIAVKRSSDGARAPRRSSPPRLNFAPWRLSNGGAARAEADSI